jgi:hypothetical protein
MQFNKRSEIIERCFEVSKDVRYVAVYIDNELSMKARDDLKDASSSDSDEYEELLVNPTLIKLTTQRGNIDCGGLKFLIIRYGNFFQFVYPLQNGHISVALEPTSDVSTLSRLLEFTLDETHRS